MEHWKFIKHIMHYLNGTWNYGLLYDKEKVTDFIGYSDADWAGDLDDRRSTSGYVFKLSCCQLEKQKTIMCGIIYS